MLTRFVSKPAFHSNVLKQQILVCKNRFDMQVYLVKFLFNQRTQVFVSTSFWGVSHLASLTWALSLHWAVCLTLGTSLSTSICCSFRVRIKHLRPFLPLHDFYFLLLFS